MVEREVLLNQSNYQAVIVEDQLVDPRFQIMHCSKPTGVVKKSVSTQSKKQVVIERHHKKEL